MRLLWSEFGLSSSKWWHRQSCGIHEFNASNFWALSPLKMKTADSSQKYYQSSTGLHDSTTSYTTT
jgi:hypothetical protein